MLTKEEVERVAKLARLKVTEAELVSYTSQISAILESFNQIAQVDTNDVKPLVTPIEISATFRADATAEYNAEQLLESAPEKNGRLYKVPPVV